MGEQIEFRTCIYVVYKKNGKNNVPLEPAEQCRKERRTTQKHWKEGIWKRWVEWLQTDTKFKQ
jgi:hypothetical protein